MNGLEEIENNTSLQNVLGPLINESRLLRESVSMVHADYSDLKETISKQNLDIKQELSQQINTNTAKLLTIAEENKYLGKENNILKECLGKI